MKEKREKKNRKKKEQEDRLPTIHLNNDCAVFSSLSSTQNFA
jgi:hypothetical protein